MSRFKYEGSKLGQISFPLGGIGSGSIGLAGNGRLIDWEIYNRPNKGGLNGFSHFAIKAETRGDVLDARILQGDLQPPYIGELGPEPSARYGFGPQRETLAGMPHFGSTSFDGRYPFANLDFKGTSFPAKIRLEAFNPFIPLNDRDSSIPAAFFEFSITNPTEHTTTYTVAGVLGNPLAGKPKPAIPLTYAQETMHGFEYAAGVQLIQNGLLREGLAVVESIRDRYDGERRNPWNEFECGSNYGRSMASYGLLNALSGFEFDMTRGHIGFRPVQIPNGRFRCFWSLASGWGEIDIRERGASLSVLQGQLTLRSIALDFCDDGEDVSVTTGRRRVPAKRDENAIHFEAPITVPAGNVLRVRGEMNRRSKGSKRRGPPHA